MEETKKEEKKTLAIELKKDVQEVMKEYLAVAGVDLDDLGFAMGWLNAKFSSDPTSMQQLMFMFQLYFFSGVYYAKTTKKFGYEMLTHNEIDKRKNKQKQEMESSMQKLKDRPNYMG